MGCDASLFTKNSKQYFYFDREYILNDHWSSKWFNIRNDGYIKKDMIGYLMMNLISIV